MTAPHNTLALFTSKRLSSHFSFLFKAATCLRAINSYERR